MITDLKLLEMPSGRRIEVLDAGPPDGLPFVLHYGTPGAAVPFAPALSAAEERGLRTIVMSRPGYGASTRCPGRSVAHVVQDTEGVLDALGADTFVCAGWSGGGPHALACSAMMPRRCVATATIASVAPYHADGLDWMDGMAPENVDEFSRAAQGEEVLRPFLESESQVYATVDGADLAAALRGLVSDADKAALDGTFADFLALQLHRAFETGIEGWLDDDLAFVRPWGFDLAAVGPVTVWQGGQDRMVPYAHGRWLAEHLPAARSHLLREHGHLSLVVASLNAIFDELAAMAKA